MLQDSVAKIRGGHRPLAGTIRLSAEKKKPTTSKKVIGFNSEWRPLADTLRIFPMNRERLSPENRASYRGERS